MNKIPACDRTKTLTSIDLNKNALPCEKALGVLWRVETDTLGFDVQATSRPCTYRGLLSIMSSVYDPLGLLSPYVLRQKCYFKRCVSKAAIGTLSCHLIYLSSGISGLQIYKN